MNKHLPYLLRATGSILILTAIIFLSRGNDSINKSPFCFYDKLFEETQGLNSILRTHPMFRNVLQIVIFGYFDLMIISVMFLWIIYGKNWRPVFTLIIFFLCRELCNNLVLIRADEDLIWNYPGIPSLTVSYRSKDDFFFSGSIGLFLICILELKDFGCKIYALVSLIVMLLHSLLLISLRAQFYFSLFCGVVFAHYCHYISEKFNHILNDAYDFDPAETERKNLIRREEKIKRIIELSVKKFKEKAPVYNRLENETGNDSAGSDPEANSNVIEEEKKESSES